MPGHRNRQRDSGIHRRVTVRVAVSVQQLHVNRVTRTERIGKIATGCRFRVRHHPRHFWRMQAAGQLRVMLFSLTLKRRFLQRLASGFVAWRPGQHHIAVVQLHFRDALAVHLHARPHGLDQRKSDAVTSGTCTAKLCRELYRPPGKQGLIRATDVQIAVRQLIPDTVRDGKRLSGPVQQLEAGAAVGKMWDRGIRINGIRHLHGDATVLSQPRGQLAQGWMLHRARPGFIKDARQLPDKQPLKTVFHRLRSFHVSGKPAQHFIHVAYIHAHQFAGVICSGLRGDKPATAAVQLKHQLHIGEMDLITRQVKPLDRFHITPARR